MISFNNGGQWHKLILLDRDGKSIECEDEYDEECLLNLILYENNDSLFTMDKITSIKSYEHTFGVIVSNGYIGNKL